jgi:hypothetical protein
VLDQVTVEDTAKGFDEVMNPSTPDAEAASE